MEQLHLTAIKHRAALYDQTGDWPSEDLDALALAGAMRWAAPKEFGGDELSAIELHLRYEWIAAASLATALILTQRDSAVALIDSSDNQKLRQDLLPHLPALVARREADGWHVKGTIPWATGADRARFVVTGAVVDDSSNETPQQILFVLSTTWNGVTLNPPMPLIALSSSHTGSITCEDVIVEGRFVLHGPAPNALAGRKKSVALGQAFLAMGVCRAGIELIDEHDSDLARETSAKFQKTLTKLRDEVLRFCDPQKSPDPSEGPRLRGACNDMALRITHAAVAIYKGTALLQGHPAQRLAREALFLLVWSCPNPVIDCTVQLLASTCGA
jgi:alkylation response protein AidB-like acyl-CoA dehydrogenase